MQQLAKGTTYTDAAPGNVVNATNLNGLVEGGILLNGAVIDQVDINGTRQIADTDVVLIGVPGNPDTNTPFKTPINKLLSESVRNQSILFGVATGSGATYAVTLTPAPTAYGAGMVVRFRANANSSAGPNINVNTIGAIPLVTAANVALGANAIVSGQIVECVYDAVNSNFQVTFGAPVVPAQLSVSTLQGLYQYAGSSFASNTYAVTLSPAATAYTAGMVVRFLAAAANVPDGSGHSYVNVNGLGAQKIFTAGGVDLLAGGIANGAMVEVVYNGTNFQLMTISQLRFTSGLIALPGAGTAISPLSHGLPGVPRQVRGVLVCLTAELGYSVGDEVPMENCYTNGAAFLIFTPSVSATTLSCIQTSAATPALRAKSTGVDTAITTANWNLKFYADS